MKFTSVRDGSAKGLTPLFFAILANRVELVEPLLQQGAEINRPVKHNDPELTLVKGASLLCYACWFGASRMVIELLLKAGRKPAPEDTIYRPGFNSHCHHDRQYIRN